MSETDEEEQGPVIVPIGQVAPDTLRRIAEEVVAREGTDYGFEEIPFERKVDQLIAALQGGEAQLAFDPATKSCGIVPRG